MNLRKTNRIKFFQQTRVILLDFLLDYVEFSLPLNLSGTCPSSGGAVKGVDENGGVWFSTFWEITHTFYSFLFG